MVVINDIEIEYDSIQIDITSVCNLSCKFCTSAVKRNKGTLLNITEIEMILKKCKELNLRHIIISGGEPFTHPDIYNILLAVKKYEFHLSITTNGTLLNTETIMKIEPLVDALQISIDSTIPDIHDQIRGVNGAFTRAIDVINKIKDTNINMTLRSTFLPSHIDSMEDLVSFAINNGANSISLNPVIASETTEIDNILTTSQNEYFFNKLEELYKKYNSKIRVSSGNPIKAVLAPWRENDENLLNDETFVGGCTAGISNLYINSKGEIWPCSHLPIKICSISDNWIEKFESSHVMKNLLSRNLKGKCGTCKFKRACGGCRGFAFGISGDYLEDIPNCFFNKLELKKGEINA